MTVHHSVTHRSTFDRFRTESLEAQRPVVREFVMVFVICRHCCLLKKIACNIGCEITGCLKRRETFHTSRIITNLLIYNSSCS